MTRVDNLGKLTPKSLVGSYFHGFGGRGWQGVVVAEPAPGTYLVQLFEWWGGTKSAQHLVPIGTMIAEEWRFYDSSEEMNDYWERHPNMFEESQ